MAHVHVVQCRREIPHESHEKERDLENMVGDEVESIYQGVVPAGLVEVKYQG